jgi:hypothetical protein
MEVKFISLGERVRRRRECQGFEVRANMYNKFQGEMENTFTMETCKDAGDDVVLGLWLC